MASVYKKIAKLGSGTFGQAWLVRLKDTDKKFALKEVRVSGMTERDKQQSLVEVEALARCKHVNIVRYRRAFVDKGILCIIMEYGEHGDLKQKIREAGGENFTEKVILDWFVQISFALKYIHGLNIIHRGQNLKYDLKTQNIFLTRQNVLKIGDFGIAKILQNSMDKASTAIGTPYYLSPEICHRHLYGTKSDIWAAGCVLYELCCLNPPFDGPDFSVLVVNIVKGIYKPIPPVYSALVEDLVGVLLQAQPDKRPSAKQILSIPAMQPYTSAYAARMKHIVLYETREEFDKENVSAIPKTPEQKRRGSWSTPKKTPLVDSNRAVNSVDIIDRRMVPKPALKKSPAFSLYRNGIHRGSKMGKSPRQPKKPSPKQKKVQIGETYTIDQTYLEPDDPNEISVDEEAFAWSQQDSKEADSKTAEMEVFRHLYGSCQAKSLQQINDSMNDLQGYLMERLGTAEFARDYELVRNALALGKDFSYIKPIIEKKLKDLFPLVIQLIQMQCCTKL